MEMKYTFECVDIIRKYNVITINKCVKFGSRYADHKILNESGGCQSECLAEVRPPLMKRVLLLQKTSAP